MSMTRASGSIAVRAARCSRTTIDASNRWTVPATLTVRCNSTGIATTKRRVPSGSGGRRPWPCGAPMVPLAMTEAASPGPDADGADLDAVAGDGRHGLLDAGEW